MNLSIFAVCICEKLRVLLRLVYTIHDSERLIWFYRRISGVGHVAPVAAVK